MAESIGEKIVLTCHSTAECAGSTSWSSRICRRRCPSSSCRGCLPRVSTCHRRVRRKEEKMDVSAEADNNIDKTRRRTDMQTHVWGRGETTWLLFLWPSIILISLMYSIARAAGTRATARERAAIFMVRFFLGNNERNFRNSVSSVCLRAEEALEREVV